MNREAIYSALYERLKTIPGLVTTSRKLRHWSDVPASEQPAMFMAQKSEPARQTQGTATIWELGVDIYLYANTQGFEAPAQALNGLLDAIEAAVAPDAPVKNACTLGGLVHHCRIEGAIETDEGTLGDQAVAIVPISIRAT